MVHFKDSPNFDKEMETVLAILERKGFVVESDHPYAYSMQYGTAFKDVSEWLAEHGYEGDLSTDGHFEPYAGAIYGLFDVSRISHEKMHKELIKEGKRQAKWP